jgi:hypothetical protein
MDNSERPYFNVSRRSFLKCAAASISTFAVTTVINPVPGMSLMADPGDGSGSAASAVIEASQADAVRQRAILDSIDPEQLMKTDALVRVPTSKAEKALMLGLMHHSKILRQQPIDMTVVPIFSSAKAINQKIADGYTFSGMAGRGGDRCSFSFDTAGAIHSDFNYMIKISRDVAGSLDAYFKMPYEVRKMGQSGGWNPWRNSQWT